MESTGLVYNCSIKAVIYIEHSYSLPDSTIKWYLRRLHGIKVSRWQAACKEIGALELVDVFKLEIPSGL